MQETEAKFRLSDAAAAEVLAALPAVGRLPVTGGRTFEQVDVYYDTPARDLAAMDALLRVRETGEERSFTLKTGKLGPGISRRTEIEAPAAGRDPGAWAVEQQAAGFLPAALCLSDLAPVLTIANRRTLLVLEGRPDEPPPVRIEMVVDRVRFSGPRGEREELELELELVSGEEEALREACEWLQSRHPLDPSAQSKYQRALAAVG